MKRYYITNNWDGKSYLCHSKITRPRHVWSRFESSKKDRVRYTYLGAIWIKLVIFILANDILTKIEEVQE